MVTAMQDLFDQFLRVRGMWKRFAPFGACRRRSTMLVATLISIGATNCAAIAQRTDGAPNADWIHDAFIHSHHSGGRYGEEWDEQIKAVQPDVMQFHAHDDGAALARKYGFHLCLTINRSGEYDFGARGYSVEKGFFPRVDAAGNPFGRMKMGRFSRHLCFNSPAIDDVLIPHYATATALLHPSQIWVDSTVITVNYCYCSACRQKFAEEYELQPPVAPADANWPQWIEFHRKSFERWMERLTRAVAEVDPNTIVTFNAAYWPNQPETPPPFIENLSIDVHSHSLWMGMCGRYATTLGLPFDIMNGLTDTWAGKKPKELDVLLEEIAAIISTGGSWDIGEFPATRDVQPADDMLKLAVAGAEFARARKPWTFHTQSVPQVAVLNSATTHYALVAPTVEKAAIRIERELYTDDGAIKRVSMDANDSRVYWFGGEYAQPDLIGAYEALVESHLHFDIVNEDVLTRWIGEYELVVLPEQFALKPSTLAAIRGYVAGGGRILATGSTVDSGLKDVLGIAKATRCQSGSAEFEQKSNSFTKHVVYDVEPTTATNLAVDAAIESPVTVLLNKWQNGSTAYLNTDVFKFYEDVSPYNVYQGGRRRPTHAAAFRVVLKSVIDQLLPDRLLRVSAPAWLDVGLRRSEDAMLVQLLNRARAYHRSSQPPSQITVDLRTSTKPTEVRLQPGAEAVQWTWAEGRLVVKLPSDQVPVHGILEIKPLK
jgi:hypothetical protein